MRLFRRRPDVPSHRTPPPPRENVNPVAEMTDAVTVAWLRDVPRARLEQVLNVNAASEHLATFGEALDEQDFDTGTYALQLRQVGDWLVLVEPNGYLTSLPELAVALTAGGGTIVSVFWNVNAVMQFLLVRDGRVLRRFDPLMPEVVMEGEPLPEEAGLLFGEIEPDPREVALELAGLLTRAPIQRAWLLEGEHPTVHARPEV